MAMKVWIWLVTFILSPNSLNRIYSFPLLFTPSRRRCASWRQHAPLKTERTSPGYLHSDPTKVEPVFNRRPLTKIFALLDVPDNFFTVTLFTSGILLQLSKGFGRYRMEERAWEQRLEEGRKLRRQAGDPAMTELDYRRQEAAQEWSAYGKPRQDEERRRQRAKELADQQMERTSDNRRRRVMVKEYGDDEGIENDKYNRQYEMTDDEIREFELEYGIDYDPYYDEPYSDEELPAGKYQVNKQYGDRIYDSGEIFYKDSKSGLYYRQGSKPRNPTFW